MFYSLRGAVAAMVFIAGVGVFSTIDRSVNYKAAKASIVMIDRMCNFVETTKEDGKSVATGVTDSCNSTDEWQTVKEKRNKVVSGTATVHVTYMAPQDGSYQTSELRFDGRDDEFYELKAGDEIEVLVSNDDPAKIRKS